MATEKTPGVYIVEENAFPNSVVEVPTAIPAFIGYSEKAQRGDTPLAGVPTRISSMSEYEAMFGGAPREVYRRDTATGAFAATSPRFHLYRALRLFFDNRGGACWIMSIGGYHAGAPRAQDYTETVWQTLAQEPEPSFYVAPDAVSLDWDGYKIVTERMLRECGDLRNRMALLDLHGGAGPDLEGAIDRFRRDIDLGGAASYGAVYAPWVNSSLTTPWAFTYMRLDMDDRAALADAVRGELPPSGDPHFAASVNDLADKLTTETEDDAEIERTHDALSAISATYMTWLKGAREAANVMPPAGAMAGIWARTDMDYGVFRAPANVVVVSVGSPTVPISDQDQEDMNAPLDGKAVNAIRLFRSRGILVWGARTLDGNSSDYRYINVRRTLIMLEQSIQTAVQAYVFAPNDASTWATVKSMIDSFLDNQWKAGVLQGTTPAEAYDVSIGLGSTMTGQDILDGYMRITVRVALTRPAEFIVITLRQKMQQG